jgi:hypothetical protein
MVARWERDLDVVYRESPLRSFQSPVQAFSLERRKQSGGAPQSEQSTLSVNVGPGTTRPGVSPRRTQSRRVYNLGGVGHCTVNTRQPNHIQFRQRHLRARSIIPRVVGTRRKYVVPDSRVSPGKTDFERISSGLELSHLRSWTTVGTPFLKFLSRRRLLINGWPDPTYSIHGPYASKRWLIVPANALIPILTLANFVAFLMLLFGRSGETGEPTLAPPQVPFVVTGMIIATIAIVILGSFSHHSGMADALTARENVARRVAARFSDRWLGLWAPTDEAIIGLQRLTSSNGLSYSWLCSPSLSREKLEPKSSPPRTVVPIAFRLNQPPHLTDLSPDATPWVWRLLKWRGILHIQPVHCRPR